MELGWEMALDTAQAPRVIPAAARAEALVSGVTCWEWAAPPALASTPSQPRGLGANLGRAGPVLPAPSRPRRELLSPDSV